MNGHTSMKTAEQIADEMKNDIRWFNERANKFGNDNPMGDRLRLQAKTLQEVFDVYFSARNLSGEKSD